MTDVKTADRELQTYIRPQTFPVAIRMLKPGEEIPEHDESGRDHEEVFLVLDGDAVMVVEGVDHPLRTGSFARLDPALRRTVRNDADVVARVLIISAPLVSGYELLDWA